MRGQNKGLKVLSTIALIIVVAAIAGVVTYFVCNATNSYNYGDFTAEENKAILNQFGLDYSSKTAISAASWKNGEPFTAYIRTDLKPDDFLRYLNYGIYNNREVREAFEKTPNSVYLENCMNTKFEGEEKLKESYNVWYQYNELKGEGLITIRRAFALDRNKEAGERIKAILAAKSETPEQKIKLIIDGFKLIGVGNI